VRHTQEHQSIGPQNTDEFIECIVVRDDMFQRARDRHGVEGRVLEWETAEMSSDVWNQVVAKDIDGVGRSRGQGDDGESGAARRGFQSDER